MSVVVIFLFLLFFSFEPALILEPRNLIVYYQFVNWYRLAREGNLDAARSLNGFCLCKQATGYALWFSTKDSVSLVMVTGIKFGLLDSLKNEVLEWVYFEVCDLQGVEPKTGECLKFFSK